MKPAEAAAIAKASRELLGQGDAEGAERVLAPVLGALRNDAPTLHLMGLIKKAQNQLTEAERLMRSAIAHALSEGAYYNDLGVVLHARGEFGEAMRVYRAAMALAPETAAVRANIVHCLLSADNLPEAEREAAAFVASQPGAESWSLLGQVQRAMERHDLALVSAGEALKFGPKLRGLQYNYAMALERVGRGGEALEIYESLAKVDIDTPEFALNYIRALFAVGRKKDAETVAEQAIQSWPGVTSLHAVLARMRWLRGEGDKCAELTEAELLWRRPSDLALRLTVADALHRGGHFSKALAALDEALRFAPQSGQLLSAKAVLLDELDRPAESLNLLRAIADAAPQSRSARRNMLSVLLRAGQAQEALALVRELRVQEPDEQYLIACECTALRMLQDPTYRQWCDHQRLVRVYDVEAPQGHFTVESFNAAFSDLLRMQHRVSAHPLDQPRSHFSQTSRNLLTLQSPLLKSFLSAVEPHVRDYISRLPEDASPVAARRTKQYRYTNLWSVRLIRDGYDPSHVHDRGWISGFYFSAVTPDEGNTYSNSGWLRLGEPNKPPPGCGPERLVEPKAGQLVLFPSYFWHGTAPFGGAELLSAAFTVAPA